MVHVFNQIRDTNHMLFVHHTSVLQSQQHSRVNREAAQDLGNDCSWKTRAAPLRRRTVRLGQQFTQNAQITMHCEVVSGGYSWHSWHAYCFTATRGSARPRGAFRRYLGRASCPHAFWDTVPEALAGRADRARYRCFFLAELMSETIVICDLMADSD